MNLRWLLALAVCFSLALAGCASATPHSEASPPLSLSPSPDSPTAVDQLTITLDGILYEHDDTTEVIPLSDGHGLLALFQSVTGVMPSGVDIEGYPPGYDWGGLTSYTWSDVKVMVFDDGRANGIAILAPAVNGVPIRTEGGISVGSGRADVHAAQGWDEADEDGDGVADYMGLDSREVPGTQSLAHSGSVGVEYVLLVMNGDTVEQIQAPGNDFSDI